MFFFSLVLVENIIHYPSNSCTIINSTTNTNSIWYSYWDDEICIWNPLAGIRKDSWPWGCYTSQMVFQHWHARPGMARCFWHFWTFVWQTCSINTRKKKLNWHHWLPGPWSVGSTVCPAIHGISQSFNPETFPDTDSPFWDCTRSWATTRWSTSVRDGSLFLSIIPTGISMRTWPFEGWMFDTFTLSRMRTTLVLSKN